MTLASLVDDIDVKVKKIAHMMDAAARKDPELGAGMATTQSLGGIQRELDTALAAAEDLDWVVREALRNSR